MSTRAEQIIDRAREFLFRRRTAYIRVFDFDNANSNAVLADLAKFCRAHETTFHEDERKSLVLQGRQEVFLRIQQHVRLSPEQLWALFSGIKD